MQPVSSRIWTRVAVSILYDDNHYTQVISECFLILLEAAMKFYDWICPLSRVIIVDIFQPFSHSYMAWHWFVGKFEQVDEK